MLHIIVDHREKSSGIPDMLLSQGINVRYNRLISGDYFINRKIMVERKTKEDFIQSLVRNRLFKQCQQIKKNNDHPLFIIEGNPYITNHKINPRAVKGALLSISVSWQIPVFFTSDKSETVEVLIMAGQQLIQKKDQGYRTGYRPKKAYKKKMFFLQGLPSVGPVLAGRLLSGFESVKEIINASNEDLLKIEGMGKTKARKIMNFIQHRTTSD